MLTTLCDKLRNLQMLSDSDICIEVENCLTDIECYSKINSANHIGFVKIKGFNDEDRHGQRYIFKTEHVRTTFESTKKYIPEELTNNGIVYRLSHINKEIKILKYEKGDHFKGKHCNGTHMENIDGACHKSLLTLIVFHLSHRRDPLAIRAIGIISITLTTSCTLTKTPISLIVIVNVLRIDR